MRWNALLCHVRWLALVIVLLSNVTKYHLSGVVLGAFRLTAADPFTGAQGPADAPASSPRHEA